MTAPLAVWAKHTIVIVKLLKVNRRKLSLTTISGMLTEHDTWTCRNCHPSTIGCLIGGMIFNEGKVSKKKCLILRATFLGRFLFRWFFMIFSGKLMNINGG